MTTEFHYTSYAQQVIFGVGALSRLGGAIDAFHWQRVILCAWGSARRNGQIARIKAALGTQLVATYDGVPQHLRQVGVSETDLPRLAEVAAQSRTVQNNQAGQYRTNRGTAAQAVIG